MDNIIDKTIKYFRGFKCEVLTSNSDNKNILSEFISKKVNNSLELYLRDLRGAWTEDSSGETRVYLIKDSEDQLAMYFSVKCGMLVEIPQDEDLSEDDQKFVDDLIGFKLKREDASIASMYDAGVSIYGQKYTDKLFSIAVRKITRKTEAKEIGQSDHTINVPVCISAIELRHLCRNENYTQKSDIGVPLGFGIFWEVIVPKILEITDLVGCQYIYLFAADKTPDTEENNIKKLVDYYKNNFKFSECDGGIQLVKPDYDRSCYGLIQKVATLQHNRDHIWEEFSDVIIENYTE